MNKIKLYKQEILAARKKSLASFSDMDYRLESVLFEGDVEWINDSKATDLESTYYSLSLFKEPIIWIVEASDLHKDYSIFERLARYQVKTIVCYGGYETNIKYSLAGIVDNYAHKSSLKEAVNFANEFKRRNNVILFSPSCPSKSPFANYKERGAYFSELVKGLKS